MTQLDTHDATDLLKKLLLISGWQSETDTKSEAFPHLSETLDPEELVQTLENLNVPYEQTTCHETEITQDDCPALVIPGHGECYVVLGRTNDTLQVADLSSNSTRPLEQKSTPCTLIRVQQFKNQPVQHPLRKVAESFRLLREMLLGLFLAAFLTNLLGLFAPLLIMAIYDRVVPSGSVDLLFGLAVGVGILAVSDFLFRSIRTKALAQVGKNGERELAVGLFSKLMRLPLSQLRRSNVNQQIARFRQIESLRELFTGQQMIVLIDLPFAVMFLAVLAYLAPPVGLLTLGLSALLFAVGIAALPIQERLDRTAAEATRASTTGIEDAVAYQRALADLGIQNQWLARYMPLAEEAEAATKNARQLRNLTQVLSQTVVTLGSVGAIILCAHGAVEGSMSFGALIASIALVSKVLAPVQAFQSSLVLLAGHRSSQKQADQVLALPEELELGLGRSHQKTLSGAISFQNVSYRPDPQNPALLTAAGLHCFPGELVVLMGRDVANRTAVLDLISGLATPSAGVIEHDSIDIRQIARDELRKSVTYATYNPRLFHGTVKQNFRLAAPTLSEAEIKSALGNLGILDEIKALPDGCNTRLTAQQISGMSDALIKSLALARSMARSSSVCLFSEPTNGLSHECRSRFKSWLNDQKSNKTIWVATADRSLMHMADRLIFLNGDRVVVNDTGPTAVKKVQAVLKAVEG